MKEVEFKEVVDFMFCYAIDDWHDLMEDMDGDSVRVLPGRQRGSLIRPRGEHPWFWSWSLRVACPAYLLCLYCLHFIDFINSRNDNLKSR